MIAPPLSSNDIRVKKKLVDTAGRLWFNMPRGKLTPQNKLHFLMLKYRHLLYRAYKPAKVKDAHIPKYFQVATIVEGPTEYYSSRIPKKQRKTSWHKEYLADTESSNWFNTKTERAQKRLEAKGNPNSWWSPLKKFRPHSRYKVRKSVVKKRKITK